MPPHALEFLNFKLCLYNPYPRSGSKIILLGMCMNRTEKLRLSADYEYGHCFKQGLFARFYEQSLYWFSFSIKPLKPMLERVKGDEPVVYGGLPISSFETLLEDGVLASVETMEYGWR